MPGISLLELHTWGGEGDSDTPKPYTESQIPKSRYSAMFRSVRFLTTVTTLSRKRAERPLSESKLSLPHHGGRHGLCAIGALHGYF